MSTCYVVLVTGNSNALYSVHTSTSIASVRPWVSVLLRAQRAAQYCIVSLINEIENDSIHNRLITNDPFTFRPFTVSFIRCHTLESKNTISYKKAQQEALS